jgi:hypothetical protein
MKQEPGKYSVAVINRGVPNENGRVYDAFRFYDNNPSQINRLDDALDNWEAEGFQVKVFRGVNRATKERAFKIVKKANLELSWDESLNDLFA